MSKLSEYIKADALDRVPTPVNSKYLTIGIDDAIEAVPFVESRRWAEAMANRRLGPNGGVPYNEQLEIARRWDRAVDAGSPITARYLYRKQA